VQERHSVRRSAADRYAGAVAYPLPVVAYPLLAAATAGVAQFEFAERLQAAVLRRRAVAVSVPAHFSAEAVPAHFFAEAAALVPRSAQPKAQRSAAPEALAEQAVAPLREESAARDAAPEPPRVAEHVGAAAGAGAAQDAAEEPRPEVAAREVAEVQRPAAPGARVRAPARPSAVLSVFRRDRLHRRPAPSPAVRFARAMASLRIASP
jgi:hypothetical protein